MEVEERRLDQMMEVDRVRSIKVDEEIEKTRKEQRLLGAMKIMEQIRENEQVIEQPCPGWGGMGLGGGAVAAHKI